MNMFTVDEILKVTRGRLLGGSRATQVRGISIDTRTIRKNELFIAIKGTTYDGHDFIAGALEKGAAGVLISSKKIKSTNARRLVSTSNSLIISVADTLNALGEIARFHRNRFDVPFVAVTGSNGKTTTKEMIENILRKRWLPLKNQGTQNNLIGVPLTLFKLTSRNRGAVIELGMNRRGEIKRLAELSRPNIGVVTNIGPTHLGYLKNLRGVYRAKKELLDYLGRGDIACLNNDDTFLRRFKKGGLKTVTFGIEKKADFQAKGINRKKGGWRFSVKGRPYFIWLAAYHEIYNALAAITVAALFNIDPFEIAAALDNYTPLEKRMAPSVFNSIEFIDDTYNSNPLSLEKAIKTLADLRTKGKKVLVSGDMLELGKKAVYYHNRMGKIVASSGIDSFISVGNLMRNTFLAAKRAGMKNAWFCPSKEEAAALLKRITRPDDVVLVKGSRATEMEDVIKCFITSSTP